MEISAKHSEITLPKVSPQQPASEQLFPCPPANNNNLEFEISRSSYPLIGYLSSTELPDIREESPMHKT